jgi:GT2 family glycosyltransferase
VVPTYRDWDQAQETLDGLLACRPRPAEIVLVDDNGEGEPPAWALSDYILLVRYPGNRGPSHARNVGAALQTGRQIEWLYFTDTGCTRPPDFFSHLSDAVATLGPRCVAAAGPVHGIAGPRSPINTYMTAEGILNPPMDRHGPQALVTANALVCSIAFARAGTFDATYPFAAGEDLDLGVKLRRLGLIAWVPEAAVYHRFEECTDDFRRRFVRYGRGTAHLEHRLGLRGLRPKAIAATCGSLQYLADLQAASMRIGYDAHAATLAYLTLPVSI